MNTKNMEWKNNAKKYVLYDHVYEFQEGKN